MNARTAKRTPKRSKPKPKRRSSGLGTFLLGMVVGGLGIFLYTGVIQDRPTSVGSGIQNLIDAASNSSDSGQPAQTEESTVRTMGSSDEFKFNFYDVLLEDEYVLPEQNQAPVKPIAAAEDPGTAQQPEAPSQPQAEPPAGVYVLQAGSFRQFADADRLKAQLALSGETSFIQKVSIEGRGDFYRVRLGPFDNLKAMDAAKGKLSGLGIKTVAFRVRKNG